MSSHRCHKQSDGPECEFGHDAGDALVLSSVVHNGRRRRVGVPFQDWERVFQYLEGLLEGSLKKMDQTWCNSLECITSLGIERL